MSVFVDSTTLLYTLDERAPEKQAGCRAWLKTLREDRRLVLSHQVINECYWVFRRKPAFINVRDRIRAHLADYSPRLCRGATLDTIARAWRIEDTFAIGWWDALLLGSADEAGCEIFLSEDLNNGQRYGGVRVMNPFLNTPAVSGAAPQDQTGVRRR